MVLRTALGMEIVMLSGQQLARHIHTVMDSTRLAVPRLIDGSALFHPRERFQVQIRLSRITGNSGGSKSMKTGIHRPVWEAKTGMTTARPHTDASTTV